jgi:phage gpG-like protein
MTAEELTQKLQTIDAGLMPQIAQIIAETANEYFKGSFRRKAFDKRPWRRTEKTTGSTLIESGNLMNSIRPIMRTAEKIIIAAGNEKVAYARVHNEGGVQYVRPHSRTSAKGKKYQVRGYGYHAWKRQFMGAANEMFDIINKRIDTYVKEKIK